MNSPRLDWQQMLIILFVLLGFGIVLASFAMDTNIMITVFTAFSALGTLAAAIAAAISARSSSQIANRWPKEEQYRLLVQHWRKAEEALFKVKKSSDQHGDFSVLFMMQKDISPSEEESTRSVLNRELERRKIKEAIYNYPDDVLREIDLMIDAVRELKLWSNFEYRPEKEEIFFRINRAIETRELQLVHLLQLRFSAAEIMGKRQDFIDRYNGQSVGLVCTRSDNHRDSLKLISDSCRALETMGATLDIERMYRLLSTTLTPKIES